MTPSSLRPNPAGGTSARKLPDTPSGIAVIHSFAALYGSERSMLAMLRQLDRAEFTPHLILPLDGPLTGPARAAGVTVHVLPWLKNARDKRPHRRLLAALRLAWWLRRHRFRVVHLN